MVDISHSGLTASIPGGDEAGGAGHTPGPWFTEYRKNSRGGYSHEVFDREGEVIATAAWFPVKLSDTATTTNREANARLIAAAPELLVAVWSLVEHFERVDGDERHKAVIAIGTSAIAKATAGETRNAEGAL